MKTTVLKLALILLVGDVSLVAQAVAQYSPDWRGMAERMVQQLKLQPGERVLLLGHPGRFDALVPHLRYAVMQAGGVDLGRLDVLPLPFPGDWDLGQIERAATGNRQALKELLKTVDATIKLPGARGPAPAYLAIQDLLEEGRGRAIHFHWDGAFPAYGQALPSQTEIDIVYQRALLETDYQALASLQRRFEDAMRQGEIRVTSPEGTDIRFRIGDRPVSRGDGDASAARAAQARTIIDREPELPCGAVRVAPLEETVEGTIVMAHSSWNGLPVEGLEMRFERGRLVSFEARSGREAVEAELRSAGEVGRSFRGFALGFNPLLAIPRRNAWIPYYGYGAGVVRLSLGRNTDLGGAVEGSYLRWNFFVNLTVTVAGRTWVRNGELLVQSN